MIPNASGKLVGGLFASGRIQLKTVKSAIAIPLPGLRTDKDGKAYVLVIAQNKIARRDVTSGTVDEVRQLVAIVTGLEAGDVAIVGPIDGLHVGDPVNVVKREG
jgi:multidrug efflux pump subunit AcrA (membrane-fusion protein)